MKKIYKLILTIIISGVFCVGLYLYYTPDFIVDNVDYNLINNKQTGVLSGAARRLNDTYDSVIEERKIVCITFDDGPSDNTTKILDILKDNNIHATFFIIGEQITDSTKPTVKRLIQEGNQIGVHTYSHEADCIYCNEDSYYDDVMKTEEVLMKEIGVTPLVYRFPWGSNNCYIKSYRKKIIKKLEKRGLKYCDWNVSGEDSIGKPTGSQIYANVKSNYNRYNQPVVLLHDSPANVETVKVLPDIIKLYKEAGYSFGIINERDRILQWNKILDD